ncbi:hypothetical protein RB195_024380 [Necator americanus]|uniref:Reverse transcriptase domain-containing protein n=2 Tax=Necator americanus TaxID=51031 RepID=A0ABR1EN35_NECAM
MDNNEEYDRLVEHLHYCTRKAESFKTTKRRLLARLCRETVKEDLKERRAEVLAEAAEVGKSTRYARRDFASRKTMITALRNPKGTTIASRREMEKIIYDFYSDLFYSHVYLPPYHLREDEYVIPEIIPSEVRHAVMSVRNRNAPGNDRIRPEHLKNLPPVLNNTLTRLFTRYLCKVPKQCKTVLLYKKGNPHDIGNYRPICLLSVIYKLFTRVIFNRIEEVFDEGQPCEHAGSFTAGISPFYKNIIIDVKKGIRQGDTISPKIFTATLENAMQQLERESEGGGRQLNYLRTADDIVQITSSISQAERMLTEFDETFGCIGLHLQKTIFIRNGWVSDAPYTLNGTNISKCTSYVYLGRELNMMNDLNPELGRRRRAAWGAYKSIEDVVKNTKNTRSPCSSRQHHCTSRFDIHAYGSMRISQAGRKRGERH